MITSIEDQLKTATINFLNTRDKFVELASTGHPDAEVAGMDYDEAKTTLEVLTRLHNNDTPTKVDREYLPWGQVCY
jgi:hypothetical protein